MSIDNLKLPKPGVLSLEQIEQVVRDYNFKPSASLAFEIFKPFADEFIAIGDASKWEHFCKDKINSHFHDLLDDLVEVTKNEKISNELLHYPLFARRRILEIIKEKDYNLFLRVISKHPLNYFSSAQLWDVNLEITDLTRAYYSFLAQLYLKQCSNNIGVESYIEFINSVTSPYKNFHEISNYYEADYRKKKVKSMFIKDLLSSRVAILFRLRKEQIEGMEKGNYFMPAPINIEAVSILTLRWLAEQSMEFKRTLSGSLLEHLCEIDKDIYTFLLKDIGLKFKSNSLNQIYIQPEFPEFYLAQSVSEQVQKNGDINAEILAKALLDFKDKKHYLNLDQQRCGQSIRYLQGRKIYKPWEIRTLNSDIRKVQKSFYEIDMELERTEEGIRKLSSLARTKLSYEEEKILFDADKISEKHEFKADQFSQPLIYEEVYSFLNKNKLAFQIKRDLKDKGYIETKKIYLSNSELVDYLDIWAKLTKGVELKELKKQYKDYRVNRVFIEYKKRTEKKSFEQIKTEKPKLTKMVNLVEGRQALDQKLISLAEIVINFSNELYAQNSSAQNANPHNNITYKLDNFLERVKSVSIVWDWLTLQIENPYVSGSDKINRFRPWFDKELSNFIREKDYLVYQALCYARPSSALGLTPGADFNWKNTDLFQDYISIITGLFIELLNANDDSFLDVFSSFKANVQSVFTEFLDSRKYDLDAASNKVLLLNNSQKHLFNSQYRADAMKAWVEFHNYAYLGVDNFSGLFFELIMKELKLNHKEIHAKFCLELLELERQKVRKLRIEAYRDIDANPDEFNELNNQLEFLDQIKRGLWS